MTRSSLPLAAALSLPAAAGVPPIDFSSMTDVPRHATALEAERESLLPRIAARGPGIPPVGPVLCPGEYGPMDGIILSYHPKYSAGIQSIVRQMATLITTAGRARAYIVFGSTASRDSTLATLQSAGADMSRVVPIVAALDSVWMRDYGPRYIYQGAIDGDPGSTGPVRAIINHTYNRPLRTTDNNFPFVFGSLRRHAVYTIPLIHGGGNYHLNALGQANATRLIVNENPSLTEAQIVGYWQQYQNVTTRLHTPFPTSVDLTQHIDMWTQIMAGDRIMVSDWPADAGSVQDVICDEAASTIFPSLGYQVWRVPARSVSGTHYTYTNIVMCNDLVLIPSYTNTTVSPLNAEALAAYQAALPGKTIVQINCQSLVTLAGVMHCICMHVPAFLGAPDASGAAPTALLLAPSAPGATFAPGQSIAFSWLTDDDVAVANVDLLLSFDSGATWPVAIAPQTADDGAHAWVMPNYFSRAARFRVVARDADGRTGFDTSDVDFILAGTCRADFNNSLDLSVQDVFDFLAAYFAGDPRADFDDSGQAGVQDLFTFLAAYFAGCG